MPEQPTDTPTVNAQNQRRAMSDSHPPGGMAPTQGGGQMAPGAPGIEPRWTTSAKQGVGTARSPLGPVWFTISHGILNEVYAPRVDQACIRDLGLVVTDASGYASEEKRHTRSEIVTLGSGVPGYRIVNTALDGRYRIEKEIIADPERMVVLQQTRFVPLVGTLSDYRLYAVLAPHLGNQGRGNTAWLGYVKSVPMLFAENERNALALACSTPWLDRSAEYVGPDDSWHELMTHGRLTRTYDKAEDGNVSLTGQIDLEASGGAFVLALGFCDAAFGAGHHAISSLLAGFESARDRYIADWLLWQATLLPLDEPDEPTHNLYRVSAAVVQSHEDKQFPGGIIASLSIPWGNTKGDQNLGGYHLVWTRDLVEAAGGLMAVGESGVARRIMRYLQVSQEADGHWAQNAWINGTPYWHGVQLDEVGLPIMLTVQAWRERTLSDEDLRGFWPMIRQALEYLLRHGPTTDQDRWEENSGFSPFTLAVEIGALRAGAEIADAVGRPTVAGLLRENADLWDCEIEAWTYVSDTDLDRKYGVAGHYVRIVPPDAPPDGPGRAEAIVTLRNRPDSESKIRVADLISPDALALVRFGLRRADDPRIRDTVRIIDGELKVEMPTGPAWHRYNGDGYGEHEDGSAYDGTGRGRPWPLLTGERAHYELAAGNIHEARRLTAVMASFANAGLMLPEQIWDSADVPEHELEFGRPSGSAMPLVWAHAEYLKLRRSLRDGMVFDGPTMPPGDVPDPPARLWRPNATRRTIPVGKRLRIETDGPTVVRFTLNGGPVAEQPTADPGLGLHRLDLPTADLPVGAEIRFSLHPTDSDNATDGGGPITITVIDPTEPSPSDRG